MNVFKKIAVCLVFVFVVVGCIYISTSFSQSPTPQISCEEQVDSMMVQYGNAISGVGSLKQELRRLQKEVSDLKARYEPKDKGSK